MHRSGTSALTRAISLLGAELPKDLLGAGRGNELGHWEPVRLVALHDDMLAEAGGGWDDWSPFDFGDLAAGRADFYRARIIDILRQDFGEAPLFVLKEPRICRFVNTYLDILSSMDVDARCIVALRGPRAVAASLKTRERFRPVFSYLLWLRHSLDAERASRGSRRVFVSYEAVLNDWRACLTRIGDELGIAWPRSIEDASDDIDAHLKPTHAHGRNDETPLQCSARIAGWINDTVDAFAALERDAEDRQAMATLDRVRAEFDRVKSDTRFRRWIFALVNSFGAGAS